MIWSLLTTTTVARYVESSFKQLEAGINHFEVRLLASIVYQKGSFLEMLVFFKIIFPVGYLGRD